MDFSTKFIKTIYKIGNFIKKNDTKILTVLSICGLVATGLTSNTAGMKWQELNDKYMYPNSLKKREGIKIYTLPVLTGLLTAGCIIGAEGLNLKKLSESAAAYMLLDKSYRTYRMKNIEKNGMKSDEEIIDAMASDMLTGKNTIYYENGFTKFNDDIDYDSNEPVLFFDKRSGVFFTASISIFQNARYHLNRNFALRGEATVNEFYEFMGVNIREDFFGWSWDMIIDMYEEPWIDIMLQRKYDKNGIEYFEITFPIEPATGYDL